MKKTLLMVTNVDWFFISHRLCIAQEASKQGWKVIVACEDTGRSSEIKSKGIEFVDFSFSRSGTNPIDELKTLWKFFILYKKVNPDVVHHITLKPVIYGSFVAKLLNVKSVLNAISGLGYTFTEGRKGTVQSMMIRLMKFGFNKRNVNFIFQNEDDYKELQHLKVLNSKNSINFIKGSGVDLDEFIFTPLPNGERIKILLPTRMLWDKGVNELREASNILRDKYYSKVTFILAGLADEDNKAGVPAVFLKSWEDGQYVKWIGYQKDMVAVYRNSDIVTLPSYREGMPKSLIEACAIGRPIVTTEAIGCKECVEEGFNGFKVPVKSIKELAVALERLIIDSDLREKMGRYSRNKAENEFSQSTVVDKHLQIYNNLIKSK